ncbi:MAG: M13 family metallopeptidase [Muricauda sp.]|nr:M13 family metallopeptidase [Allomuricauda sp.]MBA4745986.1 M13 family metallopeptidase [Allomuricauda sp.]
MKIKIFTILMMGLSLHMKAQNERSPYNDFYSYVNQQWIDSTEIPAAYGYWGSFHEVYFENQERIKGIFQELSLREDHKKGSTEQLVADLYTSCMDTVQIEQKGLAPLQPFLEQIDTVKTIEGYMNLTAQFYLYGIPAPLSVYSGLDDKNSSKYILHLGQSGLSLGNRAYYIEDNKQYQEFREQYVSLIADMFQLVGLHSGEEGKAAKMILEMETLMARIHRNPVEQRDSERRYNKKTLEELNQLTFHIDWNGFFKGLGLSENMEYVIVSQPEYFAMLDRMLKDFSIADWKTYMQWKLIRGTTSLLNKQVRDRSFAFYGMTLQGTKEQLPRWRVAQTAVDNHLGQPLGKLYVERYFPQESKDEMLSLIGNLKKAFHHRMKGYTWMSDKTKVQAHHKLDKMGVKVGYPDEWLDYTAVDVRADDYFGNVMRINEYDNVRFLNRVGKPVNPNDWSMTPPTVNAYYSSSHNEIVFPAGILNPPFFNPNLDDASNYGSIGVIIGHEITHGFDDRGSLYDADGNLSSWWEPEDREKFEARAKKIVEQYNAYIVLDSISVNGALTLGENIGDLGGLAIAFEAMKINQAKIGAKQIDGLSDEQRFFVAYANMWRVKYRDETLENQVKTDTHSPGYYRTNGPLSNFGPFIKAFNIPEGSQMRRNELITIW